MKPAVVSVKAGNNHLSSASNMGNRLTKSYDSPLSSHKQVHLLRTRVIRRYQGEARMRVTLADLSSSSVAALCCILKFRLSQIFTEFVLSFFIPICKNI